MTLNIVTEHETQTEMSSLWPKVQEMCERKPFHCEMPMPRSEYSEKSEPVDAVSENDSDTYEDIMANSAKWRQ